MPPRQVGGRGRYILHAVFALTFVLARSPVSNSSPKKSPRASSVIFLFCDVEGIHPWEVSGSRDLGRYGEIWGDLGTSGEI